MTVLMIDFEERQAQLIVSLEGIGDILALETARLKEKRVVSGLSRLLKLVERLFLLKTEDPEKFEKLMISAAYRRAKESENRNDLFDALIDPKSYLITFSTCLAQIDRVLQAAIRSDYLPITIQSVDTLIKIIQILTRHVETKLFLEQTVHQLNEVLKQSSEGVIQSSARQRITIWYQICVLFNPSMRWEYLDLLTSFLYNQLSYLIQENDLGLFESWLKTLSSGHDKNCPELIFDTFLFQIFGNRVLSNSEFVTQVQNLEIEHLAQQVNQCRLGYRQDNTVNSWINAYQVFLKRIRPLITNVTEESFEKHSKQFEQRIIRFSKHQSLIEAFVGLGVFAVANKRWEFIAEIWYYDQPIGSIISSTAPKLIPEDAAELIRLWFQKGIFEKPYGFLLNFPRYNMTADDQYFLLLLGYLAKSRGIQPEEALRFIYQPRALREVIHMLKRCESEVSELAKNEEMLDILRFPDKPSPKAAFQEADPASLEAAVTESKAMENVFDKMVPQLLVQISSIAQAKIDRYQREEPLSIRVAKEFLDECRKAYETQAEWLHSVFSTIRSYSDYSQIENASVDDNSIGIRKAVPRQMFLEDWDESYLSWFTNWGFELGQYEENLILSKIGKQCIEVTLSEVPSILGLTEGWFLITSNTVFFALISAQALKLSDRLSPLHQRLLDSDKIKQQYSCNLGSRTLPVLISGSEDPENEVLLLNANHLGSLVHGNPNMPTAEILLRSGPLVLAVSSLASNAKWKQQRLEEKKLDPTSEDGLQYLFELDSYADMSIAENIRFIQDPNFQGYKFSVTQKSERIQK